MIQMITTAEKKLANGPIFDDALNDYAGGRPHIYSSEEEEDYSISNQIDARRNTKQVNISTYEANSNVFTEKDTNETETDKINYRFINKFEKMNGDKGDNSKEDKLEML